jgi:hypothetical protein
VTQADYAKIRQSMGGLLASARRHHADRRYVLRDDACRRYDDLALQLMAARTQPAGKA